MALARVRRDDGRLPHLDLCDWRPLDAPTAAPEVVGELVEEHKLEHAPVVTVLEPGTFNLLLVEAPEVDTTELKAAVRWRIKDMLDFHIDDAVIDVFDIPGQRERGRPRMMYVVAARVSTVQERIDVLEGGGLGPEVIDIPELAQRNIAALLPEDQEGVALLQLSAAGGLITLTHQGTLYLARAIDTGLDELVPEGDLAATAALAGDDGGATLGFEGAAPGQQREMDSVVLEVQRSLDYYESHFSQPPIKSLVIAPVEREVEGLVSYLAANLGVQVRMLDLNDVLESPEPLDFALQARCISAIGAALRVEETVL
ncbi:MAG TPA: pilus assembly protein PilM [Gammaproteobacteria bacterium]|nr:pilus assembly protein PilM [Gammaproteobacteria bacterium]